MKDVTTNNFGILISYVVPGATVLWGASFVSPEISHWFGRSSMLSPTIGGFLYATIAAVAVGMTVSTVRWMTVDRIHHWTGLRRPEFNYAVLAERSGAFELLVRHHYEYFKWHGNMLIAVLFAGIARRISIGAFQKLDGADGAFLLVAVVFFIGSRDTLRNYHVRVCQLLGEREQSVETTPPMDRAEIDSIPASDTSPTETVTTEVSTPDMESDEQVTSVMARPIDYEAEELPDGDEGLSTPEENDD